MRSMRLRRLRRDDGFTLVEMVLTVAILGIVSTVLFGVILQYLKVSGSTKARLTESTDQQFISTYWQADVSSLGRQTFAAGPPATLTKAQSVFLDAPGPSNCGQALGTVVVAFAWSEFPVNAANPANVWNGTAQEVAYVRVGSAAPYQLKRVRCRAGVPGVPITVARNINSIQPISCDTSCTGATPPNRVSMIFNVRDASEPASAGYTTTVTADRRQG